MKKNFFLIISVIFCNVCFASPLIKAAASGYWNASSTWDLNRLPQSGDTIVFPAGIVVTINDDQIITGAAYLRIYGGLTFVSNNSTLSLGTGSMIVVYSGGEVSGGGSASEKLRLNGFVIFQGNNIPVSGPMMASATSNGFSAFGTTPLPVKFIGFTVTRHGADVLIQWSTAEEANAQTYQIERSEDGTGWTAVGRVQAAGNTRSIQNYSFTDEARSTRTSYYRVKEIDVDGRSLYTSIRVVKPDAEQSEIAIASVQNKVLLQFPSQINGPVIVRFVSVSGQVVGQQIINNPLGQVVMNSGLSGNYIISISNGHTINTAKQVML